ncbi:polyprenal reductase 2-like isoform X1 [Apium graveolens]|uniref:polyprenal reductase 2-like isoform X1 n=2 Tax=Apium graveolens TaxID=4045 RepID=UPI003D78D90F
MIEVNKLAEMGTLSGFLRLGWAAGIFPILIAMIPSSSLHSFRQIISGYAQRGKIMQSSSTRFTVPQKFFGHFYVVAVVWTTLLLVVTWCYANQLRSTNLQSKVWQSVFLLLLMDAQVLRRLFETIFIFKYSPSARMHIFGYLTGLFFYTAAPLSLCCTSPEVFKFATNWIEEFIVKGKNQMPSTKFNEWGIIIPLIRQRWYTWIGAGLFSWGWVHQRRCHAILGMLRENKTQAEAYVVPEGDWFNYVSSPHYLAEIVIYGGLLVASGCTDFTIWLLFAFVVANLSLAAAETHRWYLQKFDDYPSHRLAIIPFVY